MKREDEPSAMDTPKTELDQLKAACLAANAIIAQQADEMAQLTKERDHWMANHREMARQRQVLLDRPDLGDRAKSMLLLSAKRDLYRDELKATVATIEGIASFIEPHWRGASVDPTADWIIGELKHHAHLYDVCCDRADALAAALRDLLAPPDIGEMDPTSIAYDNMACDAIVARAQAALDAYDGSPSHAPVVALPFVLGQLRHLYKQLMDNGIGDQRAAAEGLVGPVIERLEKLT